MYTSIPSTSINTHTYRGFYLNQFLTGNQVRNFIEKYCCDIYQKHYSSGILTLVSADWCIGKKMKSNGTIYIKIDKSGDSLLLVDLKKLAKAFVLLQNMVVLFIPFRKIIYACFPKHLGLQMFRSLLINDVLLLSVLISERKLIIIWKSVGIVLLKCSISVFIALQCVSILMLIQ